MENLCDRDEMQFVTDGLDQNLCGHDEVQYKAEEVNLVDSNEQQLDECVGEIELHINLHCACYIV